MGERGWGYDEEVGILWWEREKRGRTDNHLPAVKVDIYSTRGSGSNPTCQQSMCE
jgi:hypothetical protein